MENNLDERLEEILETVWRRSERNSSCISDIKKHCPIEYDDSDIDALVNRNLLLRKDDKILFTDKGNAVAKRVVRRHRLTKVLISSILKLKSTEMEDIACKVEHTLLPEVEESICTLLGHPEVCPGGKPIPPGDCCGKRTQTLSHVVFGLDELEPGESGKVTFIKPSSHSQLHQLLSLGLNPDGADHAWYEKEMMLDTMKKLTPLFPISTSVRYCRNPARGIVSAIREKKINMLVMGWHGRSKTNTFRIGSTVDPIIDRSPCDIVMLKGCDIDQKYKKILVPLAGGPNSEFALEIANILVDDDDGKIVVYYVQRPNPAFKFDPGAFLDMGISKYSIPRERIELKIVQSDSVIDAIKTESKNFDLVVLGSTREPILRQWTTQTVPEQIAHACDTPLAMVKATGGLRSWIRRWI